MPSPPPPPRPPRPPPPPPRWAAATLTASIPMIASFDFIGVRLSPRPAAATHAAGAALTGGRAAEHPRHQFESLVGFRLLIRFQQGVNLRKSVCLDLRHLSRHSRVIRRQFIQLLGGL